MNSIKLFLAIEMSPAVIFNSEEKMKKKTPAIKTPATKITADVEIRTKAVEFALRDSHNIQDLLSSAMKIETYIRTGK